MKYFTKIFLVLSIFILLVGCGDAEVKVETNDGDTTYTVDNDTITTESNNNGNNFKSVTGENVPIPEGYPEDLLPVMDGGVLYDQYVFEDEFGTDISVHFRIDTSVDEAVNYYNNLLKNYSDFRYKKIEDMHDLSGVTEDGTHLSAFIMTVKGETDVKLDATYPKE